MNETGSQGSRPCGYRPATSIAATILALLPCALWAAPSVGTPVVSPSTVIAGQATPVTATCQLTTTNGDPALLTGGMNLVRLTAAGVDSAVVGVMTTTGGGSYSYTFSDTEAAAGQYQLQCVAAFAATISRVRSAAATMTATAGSSSAPTITSFAPQSGSIGTTVTVIGTNLVDSSSTAATVSLAAQAGGTLSAPLASATATTLNFVIPAGAATGKITLSSATGAATSATPFTVVPSSTYTISAAPSTANVIAGQSATYTVTSSTSTGFTGLSQLSVSGLPSGVMAAFSPAEISVGEQSILTVTAPANQATSTANLAIGATATVDGLTVPAATNVTLNVTPISTSFIGRTVVDDGTNTSLVGVTVTMVGQNGSGSATSCTGSTTSDGSGNFALTNLPPTCLGPQLVGFIGNHVTSPAGTYAGLQLVFTLISGQVVVSPVLVHLPRVNNVETFQVTQNATTDQSYTFKSIPGLSVTVYAGTVFTEQDGSKPDPFPLAAIQVPVDRLPDVMPVTSASVTAFIVAFQPAETNASKAVAVWFPNTLNTPPGTDVPLMTLDPTLGRMAPYGTGTVSNDGTTIIPDIDPSTGTLYHRFGIVHFDWHGPAFNPPPAVAPSGDSASGHGHTRQVCPCNEGDPVDLSSGVLQMTSTDLMLNGNRGSIGITRTYVTFDIQLRLFGYGSSFNYDYRLDAIQPQSVAMINLELPNGLRVPFSRIQDGTLINQTVPAMAGAVMTTAADGSAVLRWETGDYYKFQPGQQGSVMVAIGDTNGNITTIVRDSSSFLTPISEIDDPVGRKFVFTHDASGLITSITDPIGRTVSYTYDNQYLATFTNVLGGVTNYSYEFVGFGVAHTPIYRMAAVTDPDGVVLAQNTYDVNNRVATQITPSGGTIKFAYTLVNSLVPTSPVQQTQVTDPRGNVTTYRFNAAGFLVSATDPTGQTRTLDRQSGTNLLLGMHGPGTCQACGDSTAGDVTFTYDVSGNVLTKTNGLGNTTTFTYDPVFNKLTSAVDPLGNTTHLSYDARGSFIRITDARGNSTKVSRDGKGLITSIQDAIGNSTSLTYDPLIGDLVAMTNPLGQKTGFSYDGASRLASLVDPLLQTTTLALNNANQATNLVEGNGRTTQLRYDGAGLPASFTDSNGGKTQLAYDSTERVSSKTDPLNRSTGFQYDLNNNLIGFTNRRGQQANFTYDALNRLILETYPDATVQRSYDAAGRPIRVVDSQSGTFEMTYDVVGQLLKMTGPNGGISYSRDADGRVISRQVQGQPSVNYTYDANGNLIGAAMGSVSVTRTYDARNLLVANSRSNGVIGSYTYDQVGQILTMSEQSGSTAVSSRAFTYSAAGDLTGNAVDKGLPLATATASGTFDAANEIAAFGGTTYTSDAAGNRLSETSAAGNVSYTWDSRGRLQTILAPGGITTTFLYDYADNMIQKRVTSTGQDNIEAYILDDVFNIVSVQQGAAISSILDGRAPDDILAITSAGAAAFPMLDQISNGSAFTDSSGNVVGREYYEPFGAPVSSGTVSLFQFTGRPRINTGLYYDRARFYDSGTGRFLSEDPIGLAGGDADLYRYVGNNPLSFTDYTGTSAKSVNIARLNLVSIGAGIGAAGFGYGATLLVAGTTTALCPPCAAIAAGLAISGGVAYLDATLLGDTANDYGQALGISCPLPPNAPDPITDAEMRSYGLFPIPSPAQPYVGMSPYHGSISPDPYIWNRSWASIIGRRG